MLRVGAAVSGVRHYFAKDLFRQAVYIQKCILTASYAKGNYWGSSVLVLAKWVNQ